jgi:hypothetical protein
MNPIETSKAIEQRLRNYIRKTLPVERSVPEMRDQILELLDANPLMREPYLEPVPAYLPGDSLQTLVADGVIHQKTAEIFTHYFGRTEPKDVVLYQHQSDAIREVCGNGKNLVVCSGTGSGKTETFLIPLINHLVGEWIAANRPEPWDAPGVRALILYPMNALVNDQIRRLRGVLRYAPFITFGKLTGESEDNESVRKDLQENAEGYADRIREQQTTEYRGNGFDDEVRLPNEVVTRSKWRTNPAQILVSNYSMLERLLIHPQKEGGLFGSHWKFIILDEAHCYSGALGTEIAWLVRRLQRRVDVGGSQLNALQFMATSATLIDSDEPDEVKAERIRNEFASKLFPATAESIAVQFGHVSAPQNGDGVQTNVGVAGYLALLPNGDQLLRNTQKVLGDKRALKKLEECLKLLPEHGGAIAAGDALHLLNQSYHAVECKMIQGLEGVPLDQGILDARSTDTINLLIEFVKAGIGRFNQRDSWRHWLHDPGDTRPSSEDDDLVGPAGNLRRHPIGNRLYLLQQWAAEDPTVVLSREGFNYLMRVASELAIVAEFDAEPMAMVVTLSTQAEEALRGVNDTVNQAVVDNVAEKTELASQWRLRFAANGIEVKAAVTEIESVFFAALNLDGRPRHLKRVLSEAIGRMRMDGGTGLELKNVAERVFPDHDLEQAKLALCNLIDLGTLARPAGERMPLIDIRYHQLIRGIRDVHVQLSNLDGMAASTLQAGFHAPGLGFGVCRECGQPFALGYATSNDLEGQVEVQLAAERGSKYKYLHAFAWEHGERLEGQEEDPKAKVANLWLNTEDGLLKNDDAAPDFSWVSVHWHVVPSEEYPEFLAECPCCRTIQDANGTRFGIITPYEAGGAQLRLVALEELSRHADPSTDPMARNEPGEGRKVLVFSDSRRAAAQMAWLFQDFFGQVTVPRLIVETVANGPDEEAAFQQFLLRNPALVANLEMARTFFAHEQQGAALNLDVPTVALGLEKAFAQKNISGLLAVSGENGDLSDEDAAKFHLLRALKKQRRHGLLRKGRLRLHPKNHAQWTGDNVGLPGHDPEAKSIMEWMMIYLIERIKFNLPEGFPADEFNRYQKELKRDAPNPPDRNVARFVSDQRNSHSNGFLRQMLIDETTSWNTLLRSRLTNLAGIPPNVSNHLAELDTAPLRELAQIAEINDVETFRLELANQLNINNVPSGVRDAIRTCLRNFFTARAGQMLEDIWPLIADGNDAPLSNVGNDRFQLSPNNLLLLPGENFDVEYPDWAGEDRGLNEREIIPTRIEEHTAQISSDRGSAYQRAFSGGKINILSCSTTFEMGVDLGELTCVFLNGMPPAMANYRQRAGRAGRRPGSSAYVLTFVGDSPHDRYYWDQPGKLLFGAMDAPRIYLENSLFRARHLRAEALHSFLTWIEQEERLSVNFEVPNQPPPVGKEHKRKWKLVGDFFLGVTAGRRIPRDQDHGGKYAITKTFVPVVEEIAEWLHSEGVVLQNYVSQIADVGDGLPYQVAKDFLWQMQSQALENRQAPYGLGGNDVPAFRQLGGPHLLNIEKIDPNPKRRELQYLVEWEYAMGNLNQDNTPNTTFKHIDAVQKHLLSEELIKRLARNRVLPIYGFPVDVIALLPDKNDNYGRDTKLERDLRVGLYEYAPGQSVVADKRLYKTKDGPYPGVEVYDQGGLQNARMDDQSNQWYCRACEVANFQIRHDDVNPVCRLCNQAASMSQIQFVKPDAFRAELSRAYGGVRPARSVPQHVFTGGAKLPWSGAGNTRIDTAESEDGTITYLNLGPRGQGFGRVQGDNGFSLLHEVRTDIAVWRPTNGTLAMEPFTTWGNQLIDGGRSRLHGAMTSALQAILRASAWKQNIEDRDLGGLLHEPGAGDFSFVLFDDSSGGGGAVLELILSDDLAVDEKRSETIREILVKALNFCECQECSNAFGNVDGTLIPRSKEEFRSLGTEAGNAHRVQQSCYNCLRSYRNQREHAYLDRLDGGLILKALIRNGVPTAAPLLSLPEGEEFELDECPGAAGGPHRFWRVQENLVTGKYLVELPDLGHVLGRLNPNAEPMEFRYQWNGNHLLSVERGSVKAKLIQ